MLPAMSFSGIPNRNKCSFHELKKKSESVIFNQTLSFLPCVFLSSLTLMDILFPIGPFTPQKVPCNTVYL